MKVQAVVFISRVTLKRTRGQLSLPSSSFKICFVLFQRGVRAGINHFSFPSTPQERNHLSYGMSVIMTSLLLGSRRHQGIVKTELLHGSSCRLNGPVTPIPEKIHAFIQPTFALSSNLQMKRFVGREDSRKKRSLDQWSAQFLESRSEGRMGRPWIHMIDILSKV